MRSDRLLAPPQFAQFMKLPSPVSNGLRRFLVKHGLFKTVLVLTLASIVPSVLLTELIGALFGTATGWLGLTIAVCVPAVIAPFFSSIVLSMGLELDHLREEVHLMAITDDLTHAYNRGFLMKIAQELIDQARLNASPLALILFDIDDFKRINDTFGHLAGDDALRKIADACYRTLRTQDIFVRYGGEEFVILLPETDRESARNVADRVRAVIEGLKFDWAAAHTRVTVSLGVTELDTRDMDLDDLFRKADQGLYAAKGAGKNQIGLR